MVGREQRDGSCRSDTNTSGIASSGSFGVPHLLKFWSLFIVSCLHFMSPCNCRLLLYVSRYPPLPSLSFVSLASHYFTSGSSCFKRCFVLLSFIKSRFISSLIFFGFLIFTIPSSVFLFSLMSLISVFLLLLLSILFFASLASLKVWGVYCHLYCTLAGTIIPNINTSPQLSSSS